MPVTLGADNGGGVTRGAQSKTADFSEQFGRRQFLVRTDGFLDDCQQFALQRPMVPLSALAQAVDHLSGAFLIERFVGIGSEPAPIQNLNSTGGDWMYLAVTPRLLRTTHTEGRPRGGPPSLLVNSVMGRRAIA
jgi:hypothetical protein